MKIVTKILILLCLLIHQTQAYSSRLTGTFANRFGNTNSKIEKKKVHPAFTWRENVWTTTFWIGQGKLKSVPGSSCNRKSAWDRNWVASYGGLDHPTKREGYRPAAFYPKQNPFYVALPFNDLVNPDISAKWVPWWNPHTPRWTSQLKGRWIEIEHQGRSAFAQWKDVGPWVTSDPEYVFGGARHKGRAGLDVSPAVRDFLGLRGSGYTRWRFVEEKNVPPGPWWDYNPQRNKQPQSL